MGGVGVDVSANVGGGVNERANHSESTAAKETAAVAGTADGTAVTATEDAAPTTDAAVHAAARNQRQVLEAPLILAFIAEPDGWEDTFEEVASQYFASGRWDDDFAAEKRRRIDGFQKDRRDLGHSREYAIRDAMISASFAMLAAEARGWATCPMTGFDEAALKKALGADAAARDVSVALLLAVGRPAAAPKDPGRLPLERRVYVDRYPP